MNIYTFKSLGMLGQMYLGGEEVEMNGTDFYRVEDVSRERQEHEATLLKLGERSSQLEIALREVDIVAGQLKTTESRLHEALEGGHEMTDRWMRCCEERNALEKERDELKHRLEMWDAGHELVPGPTEELIAERDSALGRLDGWLKWYEEVRYELSGSNREPPDIVEERRGRISCYCGEKFDELVDWEAHRCPWAS